MLNGAESQIARTPKSEFIINPCPTECRAVADGDRTAERIISFRCQSSAACSVELRKLKLLNAEIIVFLSRPSISNRPRELSHKEFSYVCFSAFTSTQFHPEFQDRVSWISLKTFKTNWKRS